MLCEDTEREKIVMEQQTCAHTVCPEIYIVSSYI